MATTPSVDVLSKHYVLSNASQHNVLVEVYFSSSTDAFDKLSHFFFINEVKFIANDLRFSSIANNPVDTANFGVKLHFILNASVQGVDDAQVKIYHYRPFGYKGSCNFTFTKDSHTTNNVTYTSTSTIGDSFTDWTEKNYRVGKIGIVANISYVNALTDADKGFSLDIWNYSRGWFPSLSYLYNYFGNTNYFIKLANKYYNLADITQSSTNTNAIIYNTIRELEQTGSVLYFVFSSTSTKAFDKISYFFNSNSANYDEPTITTPFVNLLQVKRNDSFAIKMFFYITIDIEQNYIIQSKIKGNVVKIIINGVSVLTGDAGTSNNTSDANKTYNNTIYLKKGTFLVYVEKTHTNCVNAPNNIQLSLGLRPSNTSTWINIDTYIKNKYTPLTNATNTFTTTVNNYCKPTTNLYKLDSVCSDTLSTSNILNDAVNNDCFNPTFKKGTDNLLDSNCLDIINNTTNTTLKTTLQNSYNTWANKVVTDKAWIDNVTALNQYVTNVKPTESTFPFNSDVKDYCETNVKEFDVKTQKTNDFCNTMYNRTYTGSQKTSVDNSTNQIKINYCNTIGTDGKRKYETDTLCTPLYTSILKDSITQRCIKDGNFQYADEWCKDTSDTNINSNAAPYTTMKDARNANLKTNITSTTIKQYENNKFLTDDNYNYAISIYPTVTAKNINEELLNNKLFDYCENIEPNYPTNANSQCKGIYDKYKENTTIKDSRNRMRDYLCIQDNNLMTENTDTNTSNIYNCKSTVLDANNFNRFAVNVNEYCAKNNNLDTPECRDYYKNIEKKVADSLNLTSTSSLDNKTSSFENNEINCEDNSIYIILLFIFILLFVCVISKCYYNKYKYKHNILKCNE